MGWRGAIGAYGWPWFCPPSYRSPFLRSGDFYLSGGVSVVVARRGWVQIGTSGIQITVGWHGAVGAHGWPWFCSPWVATSLGFGGCGKKWICFGFLLLLLLLLLFGFVGMDLAVVDVDGGSGGGNGGGWFGFWI